MEWTAKFFWRSLHWLTFQSAFNLHGLLAWLFWYTELEYLKMQKHKSLKNVGDLTF